MSTISDRMNPKPLNLSLSPIYALNFDRQREAEEAQQQQSEKLGKQLGADFGSRLRLGLWIRVEGWVLPSLCNNWIS